MHAIASGHTSKGANASETAAPSGSASQSARREWKNELKERPTRHPSMLFSHDILRRDDAQRVEPPPIGTKHTKLDAVHDERFASTRQPPEEMRCEPTDGIELLIRELGSEVVVELRDAGLAFDRE